MVCLCLRERERKKRVTRPALPPGCLAPNSHQPAGAETESLLPLATVYACTPTRTHARILTLEQTSLNTTNTGTHKETHVHSHALVTKSSSPYLAVIPTCFISASHRLLSTSLICLCLYQTLSIPISCL